MVQWIGIGFAVLGMAYNTYQQYKHTNLVPPQVVVQESFAQTQPVMYYQAAFDPNSGRIFFLYPNGQWYEQIPQIRNGPTQYPANMAVGQGAQKSSVGQRDSRLASQASTNPWLR